MVVIFLIVFLHVVYSEAVFIFHANKLFTWFCCYSELPASALHTLPLFPSSSFYCCCCCDIFDCLISRGSLKNQRHLKIHNLMDQPKNQDKKMERKTPMATTSHQKKWPVQWTAEPVELESKAELWTLHLLCFCVTQHKRIVNTARSQSVTWLIDWVFSSDPYIYTAINLDSGTYCLYIPTN